MSKRNQSSPDYRYGFNGKEKDDEMKGPSNSYDFGDRFYDARLGRWLTPDPLSGSYPFVSPFNFAFNSPLQAIDPDGSLIIFVNGLMINQALAQDNRKEVSYVGSPIAATFGPNPNYRPYPTNEMSALNAEGPEYLGETFSYWAGVDTKFKEHLEDDRSIYVSGSNKFTSTASDRFLAGMQTGLELVQKIQSGEILLEKDETIKLVGHSQGGAHAAGMATVLKAAYDKGLIENPVEQIYYLAPHQATDINSPKGVFSVQYMRRTDKISSVGIVSSQLISGGSKFGKVKEVTEFVPAASKTNGFLGLFPPDGLAGNRGGHDVDTYLEIFNTPSDAYGGVTPTVPASSRVTPFKASTSNVKGFEYLPAKQDNVNNFISIPE